MKRVLLITQYYPPENGAAPVRLNSLTHWLNLKSIDVEVICPFPNYPEGKLRPEDHWKIYKKTKEIRNASEHIMHRFWTYPALGKGLGRILGYIIFSLLSFLALKKIKKPDLILVNSGPIFLCIPGLFFSWYFKCKSNLIIADLWPRSIEHLSKGFMRKLFIDALRNLEHYSYKNYTQLTAVTNGIIQYLQEKKIPQKKILYLPNGIETQTFNNKKIKTRADLNLPQNKFIFIYSGNFGNAHALESILEVAKALQRENDEKFYFLFIGGGSEKNQLIAYQKKFKLNNVKFESSVPMDQLVDYLHLSDCGLIHIKNTPLAQETRPAKLFPMMASGLPILYCGFGEGRSLLQHQKELLCSPERPNEILEKIKNLPSLQILGQYGLKNKEIVTQHYSVEILIQNWWNNISRE